MTTESAPAPRRRPPSLAREELRRAWHELRGPTQSPARAAAAVALGVFVGSFPLFGVHTPLVLVLCLWLRLDAALGWVASNVSNPLFAPFLVTAEVEVGSYLATGRFMPFDVERLGEVVRYALLGAPFVAAGLAVVAFALSYGLVRAGRAVGRGRWRRAPYALPSDAPAAWHAIERLAARFAPSTSTALGDRSRFHYLRVRLLRDASAKRVLAEAGPNPAALGTVLDLGMGHPELALLLLELGAAERVRAFGCDPAVVARAWRASCAEPALGAELETAAPEELA
ncbi:MAG: DUF2062 domain-containing protein, partial [Polyangiaceae bacterium]|nr:DUF2062 domain-containing protein [Polyangiaceae bacterium]